MNSVLSSQERIVVSGIGMITPFGSDKNTFFEKLCEGESGIAPISEFDTSRFSSHLAAEVKDFNPRDFLNVRNIRRMDKLSMMVAASARLAKDDTGLEIDETNRDRVGIILGTSYGGTDIAALFGKSLFADGPQYANPFLVPNTVMNAPAGHTSIELKFRGVNSTINHREASAETAIAYAASELKRGRADILFCGGADILSPFFFEILSNFKALSPVDGQTEKSKPFDAMRNGPVAGEGAGILCMETLAHAESRGANPYCEIVGWGMSSSPAPPNDWPEDPQGPILAIRRALESAGIEPGEIDYISASANGGRKLDALEGQAISEVFGNAEKSPFVSTIKGAVGESFSSGGIRSACMAQSIQTGCIPPILGLEKPMLPLKFVKTKADVSIKYGLINGFSSGGTFTTLIFKKI
ncbi:beta-ketoacyl-[acyl-carrier-protein] synthase family protein [bacterium]|nr:beta-ketoacyl-[acyl-carrier-protein] synthase family protein [bacterium]